MIDFRRVSSWVVVVVLALYLRAVVRAWVPGGPLHWRIKVQSSLWIPAINTSRDSTMQAEANAYDRSLIHCTQ